MNTRKPTTAIAVLVVLGLLLVAGCQTYEASWPNGPTIRVRRLATDLKAGVIEFDPQTGRLRVEQLDSETQLAKTIESLAKGVTKGVTAP